MTFMILEIIICAVLSVFFGILILNKIEDDSDTDYLG